MRRSGVSLHDDDHGHLTGSWIRPVPCRGPAEALPSAPTRHVEQPLQPPPVPGKPPDPGSLDVETSGDGECLAVQNDLREFSVGRPQTLERPRAPFLSRHGWPKPTTATLLVNVTPRSFLAMPNAYGMSRCNHPSRLPAYSLRLPQAELAVGSIPLFGAGAPRRQRQTSTSSPGTLSNSRRLAVTMTSPWAIQVAASHKS